MRLHTALTASTTNRRPATPRQHNKPTCSASSELSGVSDAARMASSTAVGGRPPDAGAGALGLATALPQASIHSCGVVVVVMVVMVVLVVVVVVVVAGGG